MKITKSPLPNRIISLPSLSNTVRPSGHSCVPTAAWIIQKGTLYFMQRQASEYDNDV